MTAKNNIRTAGSKASDSATLIFAGTTEGRLLAEYAAEIGMGCYVSTAAESTGNAYVGKHMRPAAALTQPTAVPPSPERAAAVNEGALATERHMHVNELIEDEFDHVPSKSVRRTSREYLSVIQGGTASLPRLRAEA